MHQNLAELDRNWSFLKCGQSFRENWIFWFISSHNFSFKIKSMWVNCKFSKDPISRRIHHRWFWGIRISYLRYVNYLQPSRHIPKFSIEKFSSEAWLLTRFRAVRYGHTNHYTPTAIHLFKVITVRSEKPSYDYLWRCCVDF